MPSIPGAQTVFALTVPSAQQTAIQRPLLAMASASPNPLAAMTTAAGGPSLQQRKDHLPPRHKLWRLASSSFFTRLPNPELSSSYKTNKLCATAHMACCRRKAARRRRDPHQGPNKEHLHHNSIHNRLYVCSSPGKGQTTTPMESAPEAPHGLPEAVGLLE